MADIREYRRKNHVNHIIPVAVIDGFERFFSVQTVDRFRSCGRTNHADPIDFRQMENEVRVQFGVRKNGVAVVWTPGWGIDVHYPAGREPEYLKGWDAAPNCQFVGGPCKSDGSALADGEQAHPAFREGMDALWELLERWWHRNARGEG